MESNHEAASIQKYSEEIVIKHEPAIEIEDIDECYSDEGPSSWIQDSSDPGSPPNNQETWKIDELGKFQCEVCSSSFTMVYNLVRHMRRFHPGHAPEKTRPTLRRTAENKYTVRCYICGDLFNDKYCLSRHMKTMHPESDFKIEFQCLHCESVFKSRYEVTEHFKGYHEGKEEGHFKCEDCLRSFIRINDLTRHSRRFHSNQVPKLKPRKPVFGRCNQCRHESNSKANLLSHFDKKHPGLEVDVEYKCQECEKFFKTSEEVKRHRQFQHRGISSTAKPVVRTFRAMLLHRKRRIVH